MLSRDIASNWSVLGRIFMKAPVHFQVQTLVKTLSLEFFHKHQQFQSHEQITEERRRVALTVVPECGNYFTHSTTDWDKHLRNCEEECLFLMLSRVKNLLRATMSQDRLDD